VVEVGNTNYPPYMNMPESVATFADCFDHLVLSQALDTIGYRCFAGCSRLTGDLVMPEGLKTIEGYAFAGCSGLTSLTLNDSLDYIGPYAFAECTGITGILSIPEAINVGSWAFADCTSIEGLVLPHDFTAVSYEMQDIGYVFDGCSGLTELTIPEGWTTIVKSEFSRCGNLTHVSLPESLTKIETNAFKECTNLEGINLPEGVTEIGSGAFMECRSLTQIELPTSLRTLGNQTFARCTSLAGDMVIPDLVQRIELKTFDSCYMLQSVVFGDSINYIVELAFENTNLSSLVLKAMTPPELRRMTTPNAWHFPADIPIIVPCGALEAYQDSEDWSNFTNGEVSSRAGKGFRFEGYVTNSLAVPSWSTIPVSVAAGATLRINGQPVTISKLALNGQGADATLDGVVLSNSGGTLDVEGIPNGTVVRLPVTFTNAADSVSNLSKWTLKIDNGSARGRRLKVTGGDVFVTKPGLIVSFH
jgi:hypothetical protein